MKKAKKILTIVAMTFVASVSCYAGYYCPGSTQTCPEGYDNCAPVGEIEVDDEFPEEHPITATGDMLCYKEEDQSESEYYLIEGFLIKSQDVDDLGNLGEKFIKIPVSVTSPLPLTDAILPLTLALGVYGWMIRRRQKKHRG